jgi:hypothetical protein
MLISEFWRLIFDRCHQRLHRYVRKVFLERMVSAQAILRQQRFLHSKLVGSALPRNEFVSAERCSGSRTRRTAGVVTASVARPIREDRPPRRKPILGSSDLIRMVTSTIIARHDAYETVLSVLPQDRAGDLSAVLRFCENKRLIEPRRTARKQAPCLYCRDRTVTVSYRVRQEWRRVLDLDRLFAALL